MRLVVVVYIGVGFVGAKRAWRAQLVFINDINESIGFFLTCRQLAELTRFPGNELDSLGEDLRSMIMWSGKYYSSFNLFKYKKIVSITPAAPPLLIEFEGQIWFIQLC